MRNHRANIKGLSVIISSVPDYLGRTERETDIFICRFNSLHSANSKSYIIIEWKNGKWMFGENSPVQNRPDLMEAAGMYVDKYYAKMAKKSTSALS